MERATAGLQKIVSDALRRTPPEQAPLLAWPLACGTAVAERTRPMQFAEGVLRVEVPDYGWRTELQALAAQYVAVINRYTAQSVRRIEFVVQHPSARKRPKSEA
jgi:predicted nucleic acid-binding Zn ribbon protein